MPGLIIVAYLLVVNASSFGAFAVDKRRARERGRRIPEKTLLWLSALGGAPGALAAQRLYRHKTRKQPFQAWFRLILFVQAALLTAAAALVVQLG